MGNRTEVEQLARTAYKMYNFVTMKEVKTPSNLHCNLFSSSVPGQSPRIFVKVYCIPQITSFHQLSNQNDPLILQDRNAGRKLRENDRLELLGSLEKLRTGSPIVNVSLFLDNLQNTNHSAKWPLIQEFSSRRAHGGGWNICTKQQAYHYTSSQKLHNIPVPARQAPIVSCKHSSL